ncbi:UNVERIFIED_CONTAM: ABC1 family protein [Hammondia hammondi]|eukprot:XP_008883097.1 ABC1 family protein [Hammondia hammondi]
MPGPPASLTFRLALATTPCPASLHARSSLLFPSYARREQSAFSPVFLPRPRLPSASSSASWNDRLLRVSRVLASAAHLLAPRGSLRCLPWQPLSGSFLPHSSCRPDSAFEPSLSFRFSPQVSPLSPGASVSPAGTHSPRRGLCLTDLSRNPSPTLSLSILSSPSLSPSLSLLSPISCLSSSSLAVFDSRFTSFSAASVPCLFFRSALRPSLNIPSRKGPWSAWRRGDGHAGDLVPVSQLRRKQTCLRWEPPSASRPSGVAPPLSRPCVSPCEVASLQSERGSESGARKVRRGMNSRRRQPEEKRERERRGKEKKGTDAVRLPPLSAPSHARTGFLCLVLAGCLVSDSKTRAEAKEERALRGKVAQRDNTHALRRQEVLARASDSRGMPTYPESGTARGRAAAERRESLAVRVKEKKREATREDIRGRRDCGAEGQMECGDKGNKRQASETGKRGLLESSRPRRFQPRRETSREEGKRFSREQQTELCPPLERESVTRGGPYETSSHGVSPPTYRSTFSLCLSRRSSLSSSPSSRSLSSSCSSSASSSASSLLSRVCLVPPLSRAGFRPAACHAVADTADTHFLSPVRGEEDGRLDPEKGYSFSPRSLSLAGPVGVPDLDGAEEELAALYVSLLPSAGKETSEGLATEAETEPKVSEADAGEKDEEKQTLSARIRWKCLLLWKVLQLIAVALPLAVCAGAAVLALAGLRYVVGVHTPGDSSETPRHTTETLQEVLEQALFRMIGAAATAAGPTYVKCLQWAGTRHDLFPPNLCNFCATFQRQPAGSAFAYPHVALLLRSRFGDNWRDELILDPKPVGSGCIAVVFRGLLRLHKSREKTLWMCVALKVVKPDTRDAMEADLAILQALAKLVDNLPGMQWLNLSPGAQEFAETMQRQLNLETEASNVMRFRHDFNLPSPSFPSSLSPLSTGKKSHHSSSSSLPSSSPYSDSPSSSSVSSSSSTSLFSPLFPWLASLLPSFRLSNASPSAPPGVAFPLPLLPLCDADLLVMTLEEGLPLDLLLHFSNERRRAMAREVRAEAGSGLLSAVKQFASRSDARRTSLDAAPRKRKRDANRDIKADRGREGDREGGDVCTHASEERGLHPREAVKQEMASEGEPEVDEGSSLEAELVRAAKIAARQVDENRERIGLAALHAFLQMLLLNNFLHADLHPGNVLLRRARVLLPADGSVPQTTAGGQAAGEGETESMEHVQSVGALSRNARSAIPVIPLARFGACARTDRSHLPQTQSRSPASPTPSSSSFSSSPSSTSHAEGGDGEREVRIRDSYFSPQLQLVFLDSGLAASLDGSDFENFLLLLKAVALARGEQAGRLLVERARRRLADSDAEAFVRGVAEVVKKYHSEDGDGFRLEAVQLGEVFSKMFELSRQHRVVLDSQFANVFLAMSILEGVGKQLDPHVDVLKTALPYTIRAVKKLYLSRKIQGQSRVDGREDAISERVSLEPASCCPM